MKSHFLDFNKEEIVVRLLNLFYFGFKEYDDNIKHD